MSAPILRQLVLLAVLLAAMTNSARAQKVLPPPIRFGSVASTDFVDKPMAGDTAAAEILYDFGQSKIVGGQDGFELQFERTTRLRIRSRGGYGWATVRVPLYHKDGQQERLHQLKGMTYNLSGGSSLVKTPLRTEAVFSKKRSQYVDEYAFTLPDVREGSILEFSYSIRSNFLFNLQEWQFQHEIPVRWSEYRVTIPSFFKYKELTRSYLPFASNERSTQPYSTAYHQAQRDSYGNALNNDNRFNISTQALHRRWVLKDVPGLWEEDYMTTPDDYRSQVKFELERIQFGPDKAPDFIVSTWEEIEKELLAQENFGQYLSHTTPLREAALALRTSQPDVEARATAVRQLVMQAVGYDGVPALYAHTSVRKVWEQRHGNAAEVNMLLIRTLRDAGLNAQPLLLSTRSHGQVQTELPVLSQFNYVVAHLSGLPEGKELLLDATEPYLPATLLPEHCLNGQGRLLGPAGRWIPLLPNHSHLLFTQATLQLDAYGGLAGTVRQEYAGYAVPAAREAGTALGRQWQSNHPDWILERHETSTTNPVGPLALTLTARLSGAEEPATVLYVRPLQQLVPVATPFRADARIFPVDLPAPRRTESMVTITLPPGYAATTLPASVSLALPNNGGRFVYSITQLTPHTLRITSRLLLEKTRYEAAEYPSLREFYNRALAKLAEPLVVQKQ